MKTPMCVVLLVLVMSVVPPLPAQFVRAERVGLSQPAHMAERGSPKIAIPIDVGGSYWKEGGIVTAAAAVVASAFLPLRDGRDTLFHRAIVSAVVAAIFFWPGALIGSLFPKD
jgi:hypothetical protein